jgi:hypothetical protein
VWILLDKLQVKISATFYAISRFSGMLTLACHMTLSWATPIQSTHSYPISLRSILMFSHLCRCPSSMLFISNWYILPCEVYCSYLLLFQVWTTSGSEIPCWRAWSSRKSNMYLIARGNALPRWAVLKIVSNKSSTNFWRVPYNKITQNPSSNEKETQKCHYNEM